MLTRFFTQLRGASARCLLLDYDGTLAPFRTDPAQASPYPGVRERLAELIRSTHTQVVIVSGRWTRDLVPLLDLDPMPEIWGSHGWEQLKPDGHYAVGRFDEGALRVLAEVDTWVKELAALGARSEHKPGCLAIHWRGLSDSRVERIRDWIEDKWSLTTRHPAIAWHDFDGGRELRVQGRNKGDVIHSILAAAPASSTAAYLGDDLTDEDAFRAIQNRGLAVLVRAQYRPTAAQAWLRPPHELLAFLDRWIDTCRERA